MSKTQYIEIRGLTKDSCDGLAFLLPRDIQEKFFIHEDFLKKDVIFISNDDNFDPNKFNPIDFLNQLAEESFFNNYIVPVKDIVLEQYTAKMLYGIHEGIFNPQTHCWYIKNKNGKLKLICNDEGNTIGDGCVKYFELCGKSYFSEDYYYLGNICKVHHPSLPKDGVLTVMNPNSIIREIEHGDKFCITWLDLND